MGQCMNSAVVKVVSANIEVIDTQKDPVVEEVERIPPH